MALRASGLRDIEFESEEFNRAFTVKCDDRRFANALIDGRMMAWLLEDRSRWGFEMATGWAFCAGWGEPSEGSRTAPREGHGVRGAHPTGGLGPVPTPGEASGRRAAALGRLLA